MIFKYIYTDENSPGFIKLNKKLDEYYIKLFGDSAFDIKRIN